MRPDANRYKIFYDSVLGQTVARLITRQLVLHQNPIKGDVHILLGYGLPYRDIFLASGANPYLMMPGAQGGLPWRGPDEPASKRIALVDEGHLPLADCSIDGMIIIHALEHVSRPNRFLREVWRVLKPGGHVTLIVPNRRSGWAAFETTPFAFGRPWSRRQLTRFLQDHLLTPRRSTTALVLPPLLVPALAGLMDIVEKPFRAIDAGVGGVLMITAEKEMMGGIPIAKKQKVGEPVGVTSDRGSLSEKS